MSEGKGFTVKDAPTPDADDDKVSQRERIIESVQAAGVLFWCDPDSIAYATVPLNPAHSANAVMHLRVRGRKFALTCRRLYGTAYPVKSPRGVRPGSVSDSAMTDAIPAFEAMALASANVRTPSVRLAKHRDAIWIDLGDDAFGAIRVNGKGWSVEALADAPLIRPDGIRALPEPKRDTEALRRLRELVNVPDDGGGDDTFRLIVGWLVAALFPIGPYPVLALDGEQGSGKSTICRMLRRLVDPNAADLRATPRNEDDLLIAASNGRIVALDNVSFIENDMADALCRVATGAGFGKRTLYSDLGETIISVCRPVLLNGIPSLLARGDLADRSIAVTLPHIPDDKRRPESAVWAEFELAAPGILALLLDGLVIALNRLPTLQLTRLPRMADFARLACAAAPAFGWTEADMLAALEANRAASVETVVAADAIAEAVRAVMEKNKPYQWEGTATELLKALNDVTPPEVKNERGWPKDGARLSTRLRRAAAALRRAGIDVTLPAHGGRAGRTITMKVTGSADQRSERSERSAADQTTDTNEKNRNAASGRERSGNAVSVPERSVNPLNNHGWNGGNGGNADLAIPRGEADGAEWDEVVI